MIALRKINVPYNFNILYADCEICYNGRAKSILSRGNYLIIRKDDNALAIHGADLIKPRNYLSNCKIQISDGTISAISNNESIIIKIYAIKNSLYLDNWSSQKTIISKTEAELVNKIINNWKYYFGNTPSTIHREWKSIYGPIDIVADYGDECYIIEVKRKTATITHCTQLLRYVEAIRKDPTRISCIMRPYIASPTISNRAAQYLNDNNMQWIQVTFDT